MQSNVTGKQGSQVDDGVTRLREAVERLKKKAPSDQTKVEVNALNGNYTLLHMAAYHQDVDAVRVLLWHGAGPNTPDSSGVTAIHFAASGGSTKEGGGGFVEGDVSAQIVISLLQKGADYGIKSKEYGGASNLVKSDDAQGNIANPDEYSRFWELIEKHSRVRRNGRAIQFEPPDSVLEWRKAQLPKESDHSRRSSDSSESAGHDDAQPRGYWSTFVVKSGGFSKLPSSTSKVPASSYLSQAMTWAGRLLASPPSVDTAKKHQ